MKHTVLIEPALRSADSRFVFLAVDTDRPENERVVATFAPVAWPTFFVVDPASETIRARFVGAATLEQWLAFLQSGEPERTEPWELAARKADGLADPKEAATEYEYALREAPAHWMRRGDVVTSLLAALSKSDPSQCRRRGIELFPHTALNASRTDAAYHLLSCADKTAPAEIGAFVEGYLRTLLQSNAATLSADDRSDAMLNLRAALKAQGKHDEAAAIAAAQRTFLDNTVKLAATAEEQAIYNWPRAEVYVELGVPLELAAALEASVHELPNDYDPPYRLAWIYLKGGKPELAAPHADRAAALAYGQRLLRVLGLQADIAKAMGDREQERNALTRQMNLLTERPLPMTASTARQLEETKARLNALGS